MTKQGDTRRNQIVQQATRLFSNRGFDGVTIRDLARACDISEPALYRHFESKEAIYEAVLDALEQRLNRGELFSRLQGETEVKALLTGLADHILEFFDKHREPYRLLLYATLTQHEKAAQVFRLVRQPYVDFLKARLDDLAEAGQIHVEDNLVASRCFIGMIFDCVACSIFWKRFQSIRCSPEEILSVSIPIFASGLQASGESGGR
jgi:AcrR family transcriptional regulator